MGLSEVFHDLNDGIVSTSEGVYQGIDKTFGKNPVTDIARRVDGFMHDVLDGAIDRLTGTAHAEVSGYVTSRGVLTTQEICERKGEFANYGIDINNRYGSTKSIFEACATGRSADIVPALEAAGQHFQATLTASPTQKLGR